MKTIKTTLTVLAVAAASLVSLTAGAVVNDQLRGSGAAWERGRIHEIAYVPMERRVEVYQIQSDGTLRDTGGNVMLFVDRTGK